MKTNITLKNQNDAFFGTQQMDLFLNNKSTKTDRLHMVRGLRMSQPAKPFSVQARLSFITVVNESVDSKERDKLIKAMGVSLRTYYRWLNDFETYGQGNLSVSTYVRRKS